MMCAAVRARGDLRRVSLADLRRQSAIGLLGQFGYCVSVYAAIAMGVASGTTALIDPVQPIVVATLVGPILGLHVRWAQWLGLFIGAAGVVPVVGSQTAAVDSGAEAYAFPLLAMMCLIVGTFIDRRAPSRLPVLTTLTVHVSVTATALVLVAALTNTFVPPASAGSGGPGYRGRRNPDVRGTVQPGDGLRVRRLRRGSVPRAGQRGPLA
jgi:drug/metabolite transporter (DMT)-like permease